PRTCIAFIHRHMLPLHYCRLVSALSLIVRRPPRFPLFPYTTLFRSQSARAEDFSRRAAPRRPSPARSGPLRAFTAIIGAGRKRRSEEHTSELQSREKLVCRLLLEKKNKSTR